MFALNHLWTFVQRSACRRRWLAITRYILRHSKVNYYYFERLRMYQDVLRLYISMYDLLQVKITQNRQYLPCYVRYYFITQLSLLILLEIFTESYHTLRIFRHHPDVSTLLIHKYLMHFQNVLVNQSFYHLEFLTSLIN